MSDTAPLRFEEALARLEDLVRRLESGDLTLDESLRCYEEGMRLTRYCYEKLDQAERQIEQLIEREDGSAELVPLDLELNGDGA